MVCAHEDTLEDWRTHDTLFQQDLVESDAEEELNPAFLGSLDYHSFLHGSSESKVTSSPNTSTLPGTAVATKGNKLNNTEAALGGCNALRTSLKDTPTNEPFPDTK